MGKPFTVNITRFDPYKIVPLPGVLRYQHHSGRRR